MNKTFRLVAIGISGLSLTACATTETSEGTSMMRSASSLVESACMAAVNEQVGGSQDLTVLSSEFSEANSLVMVGVGPNRAPWRCLASNDGTVQEVYFTGSDSAGVVSTPSGSGGPSSLVGMRARNMDSEMARMGYRNVGGYKTDAASFTTWWNAGSRDCVSIETRDGRVASAKSIVEGNCL